MKKIKKLSTLLLTGVLTFSIASSAFAGTALPEPLDSVSNPNQFYGTGDSFITTIASSTDKDWFAWRNDTGADRWVFIYMDFVNPSDRYLDYHFASVDQYDLSGPVPPLTVITNETGRKQVQVWVPANSVVRVQVAPQTSSQYNSSAQYEISLLGGAHG